MKKEAHFNDLIQLHPLVNLCSRRRRTQECHDSCTATAATPKVFFQRIRAFLARSGDVAVAVAAAAAAAADGSKGAGKVDAAGLDWWGPR